MYLQLDEAKKPNTPTATLDNTSVTIPINPINVYLDCLEAFASTDLTRVNWVEVSVRNTLPKQAQKSTRQQPNSFLDFPNLHGNQFLYI